MNKIDQNYSSMKYYAHITILCKQATINASYLALFDLDETLISIKSLVSFLRFYCEKSHNMSQYNRFMRLFKKLRTQDTCREIINAIYFETFKHLHVEQVNELTQLWFQNALKNSLDFFNEKVLTTFYEHKKRNACCIIITGAFQQLVVPIAHHVGANVVIANKLEEKNDKFTGKIQGLQIIGSGKGKALQQFINIFPHYDLLSAYAYADDISDYEMLSMVGHPVVTGHNQQLLGIAYQNDWPVITTDQTASMDYI